MAAVHSFAVGSLLGSLKNACLPQSSSPCASSRKAQKQYSRRDEMRSRWDGDEMNRSRDQITEGYARRDHGTMRLGTSVDAPLALGGGGGGGGGWCLLSSV